MSWIRNIWRRFIPKWREFREEWENQKLGRELIGQDRLGNKYYQYYSYYGLPLRRQVQFKTMQNMIMEDLVYYQWLYNRQIDPPTESQKQQFYLQEAQRKRKALEWDKKEEEIMLEFRKKRQEIELRNEALKELQEELEKREQLEAISTKRK